MMRSEQALYRRYRPEVFSEMVGQDGVTGLLSSALDNNRLGHAYLFSGPRGCGKTTSARVFARCLNCVNGPTSSPCGKCQSCIDLGRSGNGSLDVIEIDAASHNGVDDARALRERAIFAPAQSRFRIFILDEAHMVTTQGFNALLKIVEEPPAHVKFIFATTEPEKVLGTIRSRTFSYPFALVSASVMQPYIADICNKEKIRVEDGVLPLVVRAGGGSVRDTLSILDQLMVGKCITYESTVGLLRLAPDILLYDLFLAIAEDDGATAFASIEKVVEAGYEPVQFIEDLMSWVKDMTLAVCNAEGVFDSYAPEKVERIFALSKRFSLKDLDAMAEILFSRSNRLSGPISPRLLLEIMLASLLLAVGKSKLQVSDRVSDTQRQKGYPGNLLHNWSRVLDALKSETANMLQHSEPLRLTGSSLTIGMPQEILSRFVANKAAIDDLKSVLYKITGVQLRLSGKPIDDPDNTVKTPSSCLDNGTVTDNSGYKNTEVDDAETKEKPDNPITGEAVLVQAGAKLISEEEQ
ncbi:MAG: DNA polymerase III subunit gamma/tau [Tropheryma whipplei]|nr:DNA polymerase III subunit gamma/tau [Tropheryma whipplei]